jgi:hypothetical protein
VWRGVLGQAKDGGAVEDLIGDLGSRRPSIPDYRARPKAGLWVPSNRVEKFNDWAVSDRSPGHGMSWVPHGVISSAALEAARQDREWAGWWPDRSLPGWKLPGPLRSPGSSPGGCPSSGRIGDFPKFLTVTDFGVSVSC